MSSSTQLRSNKNQHDLKNRISKETEKTLALSMINTVNKIVGENPTISFKLLLNSGKNRFSVKDLPNLIVQYEKDSKLSNAMLIEKIAKRYPSEASELPTIIEYGYINPDGSVLLAMFGGEWRIVVTSEHKRQGTNDQRLEEGKPQQAMGNAVERAGKNISFIRTYMIDENITPYVLFADGCDFHEGSSIRGRLFALNDGGSFNTLNIFVTPESKRRPISMFVREKTWTELEMRIVITELALKSIAYYIQKYKI